MEIHRPKPFHGWRELAKEVGVITIGIAIALGGDQVLQWLHQGHEVAEARRAIRFEIARNVDIALFSIEEERCRLGIFNLFIARVDGGSPPPQIKGSPGLRGPTSSAWEVAKTGATAHMPFEERLAYSTFYELVDGQKYVVERDREAAMRGMGFTGRTEFTAADKQGVRDVMAQQRTLGQLRTFISTAMVSQAKAMGVAPQPISADNRAALNLLCAQAGMTPPFSGSAG